MDRVEDGGQPVCLVGECAAAPGRRSPGLNAAGACASSSQEPHVAAWDGVVSEPARKWDPKIYGIGAQILKRLGVGRMRLMSKPLKIPSMTGFSLEVCGYLEAASRQS